MRLIIVGAGEVGTHIAERLSREKHDITVIEIYPDVLARLENLDVLGVLGNGASARLLEEAGIRKADALIAVTNHDEVNMLSCMIARHFGVPTKIARIKNPDYFSSVATLTMEQLGIDRVINPDAVTAQMIIKLLRLSAATDVAQFAAGRVTLAGFKVERNAPIIGKKMVDLGSFQLKGKLLVAGIYRNGETIIPRGNDSIQEGDQVFFFGHTSEMSLATKLVGRESFPLSKVMIFGANRISLRIAGHLMENNISVKVLENDEKKCVWFSEMLPRALVLKGGGTEFALLDEEGIAATDVFIAVSGEDGDNVLACLLAKQGGVKKTITMLKRSDYYKLVTQVGIDGAVSPRLAVASSVLKHIRRSKIFSMTTLTENDAEVIEFVVPPGSSVIGKPISEVSFPRGALIGAIYNKAGAKIATGQAQIQANDHVIVFALPESIPELESIFASKSRTAEEDLVHSFTRVEKEKKL